MTGSEPRADEALSAWWTGTSTNGLPAATGWRVRVEGVDAFEPGPVIVVSHRASDPGDQWLRMDAGAGAGPARM